MDNWIVIDGSGRILKSIGPRREAYCRRKAKEGARVMWEMLLCGGNHYSELEAQDMDLRAIGTDEVPTLQSVYLECYFFTTERYMVTRPLFFTSIKYTRIAEFTPGLVAMNLSVLLYNSASES